MSKTLKQLLDRVMGRSGFEIQPAYANSPDADAAQAFYIANESVARLREEGWNELVRRGTLTMTSSETYAPPSDFLGLVSDTAYVHNDMRPLNFPCSPAEWNFIKATSAPTGNTWRLRYIGGAIAILTPTPGTIVDYEYMSNAPITSNTGAAAQEFVTDSDVWNLDDELFLLDMRWRWKREKGLDWQVDNRAYDRYKRILRARNQGAQTIVPGYSDGPTDPYTTNWAPPSHG